MPSSLWVSRQGIPKIMEEMHTIFIYDACTHTKYYILIYTYIYNYVNIAVYIYICVCAYVYSCYTIHINIYVKMPSLSLYVTCYICICYPHICIYTIPVWSCIYSLISLQIIYSRIALDMQMAGERNSFRPSPWAIFPHNIGWIFFDFL
jgi:hypothetical protein